MEVIPALFTTSELERHCRSFGEQDRVEQHRRIDAVIALSQEYAGLEEAGVTHCMLIVKGAIMSIVDGDLKALAAAKEVILGITADERTREHSAILFGGVVKIIDEFVRMTPRGP